MKKGTKRSILVIVPAAILITAVFWWMGKGSQTAKSAGPAVASVVRHDFSSSVLATGVVRPQVGAEVRVGARITGKVESLPANIGDSVKKGQIIAELEKNDLMANVERLQAEVGVAEAKLDDAEARSQLAEIELQRQQKLLENDFTSRQEVDIAGKEAMVAKAQVDLAKKQIESANAAMREARVRLSYATITAPMDGVIGSVSTQLGENVVAGLSAPTFVTIIDLERLQVDAFVDEVDIGRVTVGQEAYFSVDTFPGKEFTGKVVAIYPKAVIQQDVVNYDVVVEITEPYKGLLRPEMTASVTILMETRQGVLALPSRAIHRENGRTVVYLAGSSGNPETRPVAVGMSDGDWIEIASGLEEGQTVLLDVPLSE